MRYLLADGNDAIPIVGDYRTILFSGHSLNSSFSTVNFAAHLDRHNIQTGIIQHFIHAGRFVLKTGRPRFCT